MSLFFYIHSLHETLILSFFVTCMNIQSKLMKQIDLSQFENVVISLSLVGINPIIYYILSAAATSQQCCYGQIEPVDQADWQ